MSRIRVLVAGDVYVNRSLVRPFLEDDGYDVVGEAVSSADVVLAVAREQPDAVVIDDRLLRGRPGGGTIEKIRRAAPDAKLIVMTSAPGPVKRAGADAYLPRGVSLAAVSALLGQLLGAQIAPEPLAGVATGGPPGAPGVRERKASRESRGGVARFAATVAAPLLVVWALIAALTTGGAPTPPAITSALGGGIFVVPQGTDSFDMAEVALDRMIEAIRAGNYVLATVHAKALMDAREMALAIGYSTQGLDHEITFRIRALAELLPPGVAESLQDIFGHLFPVLPSEETPGGGSGLIFGPTTGSGGSGGTTTSGGGGDTTAGGNGGGGGDGTGGGGDGDGVIDDVLGPGDGREWGLSHKADRDAPPPWAPAYGHRDEPHGHRCDPPGHEAGHEHGNGKGHGHTKERCPP